MTQKRVARTNSQAILKKARSYRATIDSEGRRLIADATAMAVIMDLRPLGFAEEHEGIGNHAKDIFKAGQSVPDGVKIQRSSYDPSRTAVDSSLTRLVETMRVKLAKLFQEHIGSLKGAITFHDVTLKV